MIQGSGVDIIEIERIQKSIDRWGDHFINHIFTEEEIAYCQKHKFSAQHFAARFAAKEAIFKAVSNKAHLGWKDIAIKNDENGKPFCVIDTKFTHGKIFLSLSHTNHYAIASAIIVCENEK